jgi:hypothetical protein
VSISHAQPVAPSQDCCSQALGEAVMAKDITAKLVAFAEGRIKDPEIVTEIDGLLHGNVEGGLDKDTKLEIAAAIEASQALAKLVERDQKAARLVNEAIIPELKRQADEIEADTKLEAWLKDYAADPDNWGEDPNELRQPVFRTSPYRQYCRSL